MYTDQVRLKVCNLQSSVLHPEKEVVIKEKNGVSVLLFETPWTVAYQAPLSMRFSRQQYWSGLPFPSPGNFPTQGSNPGLPHCRQTGHYILKVICKQKNKTPIEFSLPQTKSKDLGYSVTEKRRSGLRRSTVKSPLENRK